MTSPRRLKQAAVAARATQLETKRRRGFTAAGPASLPAGVATSCVLRMLIPGILVPRGGRCFPRQGGVRELDQNPSESDHPCVAAPTHFGLERSCCGEPHVDVYVALDIGGT